MQLWFWAAVGGMVLAGISNFGFKIAAKRGYDSETFNLYAGATSVLFAGACLLLIQPSDVNAVGVILVTLFSGVVATTGGIMKVYALRNIDTTIFFPLFKLLSPLLAVMAGIVFFEESFTPVEWAGILLGLSIPLLLINKIEHTRQANLVSGLIFVVLVSASSAAAAAMNKYAIDLGMSNWTALWYTVLGIVVGTMCILLMKFRGTIWQHIYSHSSVGLVVQAAFRAILISGSTLLVFYAYGHGGDLAIVQVIHAHYIVISIVLAVLVYQEHINWKKTLAIVLSIVAVSFLG